MKTINWYIFRQIATATFMVTLVLTLVLWLTTSLRFIDYIVNRGLPLSSFVTMIGVTLPTFLSVILPIALFASILFVYHKLLGDSELVILRAAGFSPLALAKPALMVAMVMCVLGYPLTLYLMPAGYHVFKSRQADLRREYASVVLQEGTFNRLMPDVTVYVANRNPEGFLEGIIVHDARDKQSPITYLAKQGALIKTASGPRLLLLSGNQQQVDRENGRLSLLYFDSYTAEFLKEQEEDTNRWQDARERFLPELFDPSWNAAGEMPARFRTELMAEGHQRLITPLLHISYALIAIASLLSGEFSRRGQSKRLLIGVVALLVHLSLGFTMQNLARESFLLGYMMYLPPVLFSLGALYVLNMGKPKNVPERTPKDYYKNFIKIDTNDQDTKEENTVISKMKVSLKKIKGGQ